MSHCVTWFAIRYLTDTHLKLKHIQLSLQVEERMFHISLDLRDLFMSNLLLSKEYSEFLTELKQKISIARNTTAHAVNKNLLLLYHGIGTEILARQNIHGWGAKVIDLLSRDLSSAFPDMRGFSKRNLKYMRLFAQTYPDPQFVQVTLAQLTWYHNITLLNKLNNKEERLFYLQKAVFHGWTTPMMVHQIELDLYRRQGKTINNFKENLPSPQSDLANQTLKDPTYNI